MTPRIRIARVCRVRSLLMILLCAVIAAGLSYTVVPPLYKHFHPRYSVQTTESRELAFTGIPLSPHDRVFLQSVPQLKDRKPDKQVCMDMSQAGSGTRIGSWSAQVQCFSPDEFTTLKKTGAFGTDTKKFEEDLSQAQVMTGVYEVNEHQKIPFLQFVDHVGPDTLLDQRYMDARRSLAAKIQSGEGDKTDASHYTYMLSLEGHYDEANALRTTTCTQYHTLCPDDRIEIIVDGLVSWSDGTPLPWATVSVLGTDEMTTADDTGHYHLDFKTYPEAKIRIDAIKTGFSNGTFPLLIASRDPQTQSFVKDFTLPSPLQTAEIDTEHRTITGSGTSVEGGDFVVRTPQDLYHIPSGTLVHADGTPFVGQVHAYFFELDGSPTTNDLLVNDIFDEAIGYAGNILETSDTPYAIFLTDAGERIHILQSHPILLRSMVQSLDHTGSSEITDPPITDDDLRSLMDASRTLGWYPIDWAYLISHHMLRFPAFFVFDQTTGVWSNVGMRVVGMDGTIEAPFYTAVQPVKKSSHGN